MPRAQQGSEDLKRTLKATLVETLHEQRDFLREIVAEAIEDAGLAEAIREGLNTKPATRNEVFRALGRDS